MATASDLIGEPEKAKAADETNQRLRASGIPRDGYYDVVDDLG